MEFVNEFTVPIDIDTAWKTLLDLEAVAACLPGATLDEVDGALHSGQVRVTVGPITVNYRGTAELVDVDEEAKSARIDAKGQEARGTGTADADVTAKLTETVEGTLVHVVTDLTVTGRPAQFGRGVMGEVGTRIIGEFAERLEALVLSGDPDGATSEGAPGAATPDAAAAETATPDDAAVEGATPDGDGDTVAPAAGGEAQATGAAAANATPDTTTDRWPIDAGPSNADDALDLMDVAGPATLRRAVPLAAGLAAAAAFIWWLVRR